MYIHSLPHYFSSFLIFQQTCSDVYLFIFFKLFFNTWLVWNLFIILIYLYFYFFSYIYPTMDELANQLNFVLSYFGLESVIGFGVGAGGNILARFAYLQPEKVNSITFVNWVLVTNKIYQCTKINSSFLFFAQ